jgi:hypothetical protein
MQQLNRKQDTSEMQYISDRMLLFFFLDSTARKNIHNNLCKN